MSAVGTAAPAAIGVAVTAIFPLAALATIPAAVAGWLLSRGIVRRQLCADLGISPEVLARIEKLTDEIALDDFKRDIRSLTAREWLGINRDRMVKEIAKRLAD